MSAPVTTAVYASGWRMWTATGLMMLCSWLSYVDRQMLAVLSPTILADTHMSIETYTTVVAWFSYAYMIGNPLWGLLLDYLGVRRGMLLSVGLWSVASGAHAFMGGYGGFAAARTVLGLGEGATFPGGLRTAMESLPPDRRARGLALSYSGGSLGAILTPLMVVPIAAMFGWRASFLLTAGLGAAWVALWWVTARPPYLPEARHERARIVWPNPFERRFWALVAAYAVGAFGIGPILYLAPIYLQRAHAQTQADLGTLLWIPPLGWEVGYFTWGWISDRYQAEQRPLPIYALLAVLSLPLAAVTIVSSVAAVMALFFWAMFVTAGYIVVSLRAGAREYPREQTAMVAGIAAGSWSALVAVVLPVLGRWFDQGLYQQTFLLVSVMPAAGTLLCWIVALLGRRMEVREAR